MTSMDMSQHPMTLPCSPPVGAPFAALTGSEEGKYIFTAAGEDVHTHYWWLLKDISKGDYLALVATEIELNWLQLGSRHQLELLCVGNIRESSASPEEPSELSWKTLSTEEVVTIQRQMLASWEPLASREKPTYRLRVLSQPPDHLVVESPEEAKGWVLDNRLRQGQRNIVGVLETTPEGEEVIRAPTEAERILMTTSRLRVHKIC